MGGELHAVAGRHSFFQAVGNWSVDGLGSGMGSLNGKSGRQSWRYADAFQRSIISEAIYHLPFRPIYEQGGGGVYSYSFQQVTDYSRGKSWKVNLSSPGEQFCKAKQLANKTTKHWA